jgi:threonine synthase
MSIPPLHAMLHKSPTLTTDLTQLKKKREQERADAIARGFLADPDKPRTLAEAITPVGTCPDMCAEFERLERVVQKDVWNAEMVCYVLRAYSDGKVEVAR